MDLILRVHFHWCGNWEFTAFSFEICRPVLAFSPHYAQPYIFRLFSQATSEKPTGTGIRVVKMKAGATLFYYLILFNPTLFVSYSEILVIENYQLFCRNLHLMAPGGVVPHLQTGMSQLTCQLSKSVM